MHLRGSKVGGDPSVLIRSLLGTSGEPVFNSVHLESWRRLLSWAGHGHSAVTSCFIPWTSPSHEAPVTWEETHIPACTRLSGPGAMGLVWANQCVSGVAREEGTRGGRRRLCKGVGLFELSSPGPVAFWGLAEWEVISTCLLTLAVCQSRKVSVRNEPRPFL